MLPIRRFEGVRICGHLNKTYKTNKFPEIPSKTTGKITMIFTIISEAGLHIHIVFMKGVFEMSI